MDRSSRRCTQEAIETFEDRMSTNAQPDPRRWKALAVLGVAYLMVVLDVSIVNVALPSIQQELDFAPEDLQWVVSGYALTFGGFLLLGGRAGDLLGRRALHESGWCSSHVLARLRPRGLLRDADRRPRRSRAPRARSSRPRSSRSRW